MFIGSDFTQTTFNSAPDWNINPSVPDPFTICGIYGGLFGGHGKFGLNTEVCKTYQWTNIAHYAVEVQMSILKIDSWDSGNLTTDNLYVYLDGNLQDVINSSNKDDGISSHQCGQEKNLNENQSNENKIDKNYYMSHVNSSLTLMFLSSFDEPTTDESWGVRDIKIKLKICDSTCSACSGGSYLQCTACHVNAIFSGTFCLCREYYYHQDSIIPCTANPCGSCERCHISCRTCKGPESTDCLSCDANDVWSSSTGTCTKMNSNLNCPYIFIFY